MDKNHLYVKRAALQKKIELNERLSLIEDVTNFLDDNQIPYGIEFKDQFSKWISDRFPWNFSGINWEETVGATKLNYSSNYQRDRIISTSLSENLSLDDLITVIWSNALRPSIEIRSEILINFPAVFADQDFDMWVIHFQSNFVMECYHEGYVG